MMVDTFGGLRSALVDSLKTSGKLDTLKVRALFFSVCPPSPPVFVMAIARHQALPTVPHAGLSLISLHAPPLLLSAVADASAQPSAG